MRGNIFYLTVVFAIFFLEKSSSRRVTKCNLLGTWKNELGSTLQVDQVGYSGRISGSYVTIVVDTKTQKKSNYTGSVAGLQQKTDEPTFGFIVKWSFVDSSTAWVGQCFQNQTGGEVLETIWLLRSPVTKQADNWKGTKVGSDFFYRIKEW
ncbi:avidin-like isoform X2 [Latimeria chalumnae]|uniref:Avidin n=1 Tax=Latimeria chalumnae TaxID=7897 RepID=M3XJF5_LATCH|nr:PREDICTED: avidin-like [Latimeria chalumnae]|eukprot:XP_006007099.1 PREDICTED: avidin-like [Latimeria chalumnae]